MALGDVVFFNQFKVDLGEKKIDLKSDQFKIGLITGSVTPTAATAAPHWGGTGTTNFATSQVTPGGNYVTGGPVIASTDYIDNSGVIEWRGGKISIAQAVGNPTNARWGIIYDNTAAAKNAIAFVDFGSDRDLSATSLEVLWNNTDGVGIIGRWPA